MSIKLYKNQVELRDAVNASWNSGNKNVLMVFPTGGGKTVIIADISCMRHCSQTGINWANIYVTCSKRYYS